MCRCFTDLFDLGHQHLLQFTNDWVKIESQDIFRAVFTEVDERCAGMCLNPWVCIVIHYQQKATHNLPQNISALCKQRNQTQQPWPRLLYYPLHATDQQKHSTHHHTTIKIASEYQAFVSDAAYAMSHAAAEQQLVVGRGHGYRLAAPSLQPEHGSTELAVVQPAECEWWPERAAQ